MDFTPDGTGKPTPSVAGGYRDDVATDSRATAAGPMTTRVAVKAHIEMLAGIRRHFESA